MGDGPRRIAGAGGAGRGVPSSGGGRRTRGLRGAAVGGVTDGEASGRVEGEGASMRLIEVKGRSSEEAVAKAERLLEQHAPGALRGVMAFEAYLNLPPGKTDAIFLHARQYVPEAQEIYVAVPFRTPKSR